MVPQYAAQNVTGAVLVTGETVDFRCMPKPPPPKTLRDYLNGLVGKNIRAAIAYLGYPDSQETIVGDVVYTWDHSAITNVPHVVTSTTGAVIGDNVGTADTTSISSEMVALRCELRIGTDTSGTIKRYQLDGNTSTCADYARGFQVDPLPKPATRTQ